jgi:hypothetical protein
MVFRIFPYLETRLLSLRNDAQAGILTLHVACNKWKKPLFSPASGVEIMALEEKYRFSESGAEFRARILQSREASKQDAVDGRLTIRPDPELVDKSPAEMAQIIAKLDEAKGGSAQALMQAPAIHGGAGGSRRKSKKKKLRTIYSATAQWCPNCQERKTSDLEVCQQCGSALKLEPKGPPRHARIPPEYKALLDNSPDLYLRDVIEFLTHADRWKNGDLKEWVDSFDCGKKRDRAEELGGRPRDYGRWRGEKVQGRLPLSLEDELARMGASFERGAALHFTAVCLMAFEIYTEALTILKGPPGWGIDPDTPIPEEGAVALLQSSPEECKELCALMDRPDFDAVIAADLQRKSGSMVLPTEM